MYNWIPLYFQFQACTLDNCSKIKIIPGVVIQGFIIQNVITQDVVFIAPSSTAALLHRKPTSTVTSHDSCCTSGNYKRCIVIIQLGHYWEVRNV
jgi:hypothetical protein